MTPFSIEKPKLSVGLLAVLLLAAGPSACSDCRSSQSSIPEDADRRVAEMARALPADTRAVAFVGDMTSFVDGLSGWKDLAGTATPGLDILTTQIDAQLGVDPFRAESWRAAGIPTGGGFSLALVDAHPIVVAYVDERIQFERTLLHRAGAHYEIRETPRNETIAEQSVKISRKDDGDTLVWTYFEQMAVVVFPAVDALPGSGAASTVPETMDDLIELGHDQSLETDDGYREFRDAFDGRSNGFFVDPTLVSRLLGGEMDLQSVMARLATSIVLEPVTGIGGVLEGTDGRYGGEVWLGLDAEGRATLDGISREADESLWSNLAAGETLLDLRLRLDWSALWSALTGASPESVTERVRERLAAWSEDLGVDIEADILEPFTGDAALFVYDVGSKTEAPSGPEGSIWRLDRLEALGAFRFQSEEAVSHLREQLLGPDDASDTFEIPGLSARAIFDDSSIYVVSTALGPAEFRERLGDESGADVPSVDGSLLSARARAGRVQEALEPSVTADSRIHSLLDRLRRAEVVLTPKPSGLLASLTLLVEP